MFTGLVKKGNLSFQLKPLIMQKDLFSQGCPGVLDGGGWGEETSIVLMALLLAFEGQWLLLLEMG